jgi:hypothetical protein
MYVCIMRQCFGVGTSYGSWLGLAILALGWDATLVVGFIYIVIFNAHKLHYNIDGRGRYSFGWVRDYYY